MRLYYHPVSSNSRRALMTALQLDLQLELIVVDLAKREQKLPDYLRRNPNGRVPVLVDGELTLWESRAIMLHLASRAPSQSLYPADPARRADVHRWMFWCAAHFSPALAIFTFENFVKRITNAGDPDPVELQRGERLVAQFAPVLDAHLADREWIVGDHLTLADLCLSPALALAGPAGIPVAQYAHLQRWFARVQELEVWNKTAPPRM